VIVLSFRNPPGGGLVSGYGDVQNRSPRSINFTYFIEITRLIELLSFEVKRGSEATPP
jgi:hypothetical protein